MPFKIEFTGMDELIRKMDKLPEVAAKVAAESLYEGAGVVADAVSGAVQGIATEPFKYAKGGKRRKPSPEEKAIVANARHGVAKFKNDGNTIQTSIGYQKAGYATLKGKTKPVPVIVNAINSGTSFMQKQPFLRKAFSKSKSAAIATIQAGIEARADQFDLG